MPLFTPPTAYDNPPILPDTRGLAYRLFKFGPNRARYIRVYKLGDGTYVQDTPSTENQNTNIPWPINPNDPYAPYVTSYYTDYSTTPPSNAVTKTSHTNPVVLEYIVPTEVTTAEAAALTAAGYGDLIT